jgi:L-arabinose isomerase
MEKEIEQYFMEKYKKASFRMVPGHWPDFKTKEEVDKWIDFMESMRKVRESEGE